MTKLFQLLSQEDNGFLDRFASRKHGKKRRFLARDKHDLYPGRPDLVEQHSVEVVSGWWLGTNYSRRNIQDIIGLALEVAGPQLRNVTEANVL
jgi:predicted type IV restriction endonuclease